MWCSEHDAPVNDRTRICSIVRMAYQRLDAGTDGAGNPQRAFVVYDLADGDVITAIDEGYLGLRALKQAGFEREQMVELPGYQVAKAEYDRAMFEYSRGLIAWPLSQMHKPRKA